MFTFKFNMAIYAPIPHVSSRRKAKMEGNAKEIEEEGELLQQEDERKRSKILLRQYTQFWMFLLNYFYCIKCTTAVELLIFCIIQRPGNEEITMQLILHPQQVAGLLLMNWRWSRRRSSSRSILLCLNRGLSFGPEMQSISLWNWNYFVFALPCVLPSHFRASLSFQFQPRDYKLIFTSSDESMMMLMEWQRTRRHEGMEWNNQ